jgi:iron complex outermembrane receptor protein
MGKNLIRLLLLTLVICLSFSGFCLAEEDETEDEFTLEEITVTAQKREENQQKVAIAMEVVTGEDLVSMGKNNVDEILKDIPNALINTGSDGMRISLRGITDDSTTFEDQRTSDSAVALNIDGAYNNMANAGQNLFDIERVEVLMGPQSTMYGSNAPGGVVNVVTASPKTDKWSASASLEYGSYDLLNAQGSVNVPIFQDKLALRVATSYSEQGSYVEGEDSDSDTTSVRLKVLYEPFEKLSFEVTGNYSVRSGGGQMGGSVKPFIDQDGYYPDGTKVTDPWTAAENEEGGGGGGGNQSDQTTEGLTANIEWETPLGNITATPSYSKSESDSSGERMGSYQTNEDSNEQTGGELRMTNASTFELFQWILGGTYYESEQVRATSAEGQNDSGQFTTSKKVAAYANITYPLWFYDKLALTLGYRQSWDDNSSVEQKSTGQTSETGTDETESNPDWKYGFEWDAADNLMIYGSFSSSYRMPNAMAMSSEGALREELDAYSLGAKSRWLDNRLQVNLSIYYYDYANKLCNSFKVAEDITELDLGGDYITISDEEAQGGPGGPPGGGSSGRAAELVENADGSYGDGEYPNYDNAEDLDADGSINDIFNFTINEPSAQGYGAFTSLGIDLSTTFIVTSKDRVNFSVSYLDAEWKDLTFEYDWFMYWAPPDGIESYEGVTPVNSPEWSMTANYEHNFTLGALGTLTPRIDAQYKSEYTLLWNSEYNDDGGVSIQEAYYLFDASASFNHSSGKWSLSAYVKNITDYAVKVSYMGQTGSEEMRLGDPRTFGATFSIKF